MNIRGPALAWASVCFLMASGCQEREAAVTAPLLEGMALVPGWPFLMGSTEEQIEAVQTAYGVERPIYEAETPQRLVDLASFSIDRTEVTQSEYAKFVQATGREAPFVDAEWAGSYNWVDGKPPKGLDDHPVVLVSFDDAMEYCRWSGKALPTESQWEKAARGGDGRTYPWGGQWDADRLNSAVTWATTELTSNADWLAWWKETYHGKLRGRVVTTKPVGSYPAGASPYGVEDMAGNVFEWVNDWYNAYPGSHYENPEFGEKYRVVRGGDWYLDPIYNRTAARLRSPPEHKVPTIGFRCVAEGAAKSKK